MASSKFSHKKILYEECNCPDMKDRCHISISTGLKDNRQVVETIYNNGGVKLSKTKVFCIPKVMIEKILTNINILLKCRTIIVKYNEDGRRRNKVLRERTVNSICSLNEKRVKRKKTN